jgi:hypothetical protein
VHQGQHEVGVIGAQARQRVGHEALRGAGERAYPQTAQLARGLAHGQGCHIRLGQEPFGAREQHGARRGQPHSARATQEKRTPQLVLQVRNVLRHRRSGVAKGLSRRGERPQTRGLDERSQPQEIHHLTIFFLWSGLLSLH